MTCKRERGYAMAALLVALSVMSIMLGVALPAWRTMVQREREAAYEQATVSKEDLAPRTVACGECGAPVGRGRFCPECGAATSQSRSCSGCSAEVPAGAKFCPECGQKAA